VSIYTNRDLETTSVKDIRRYEDGTAAITAETGWTALAPPEAAALLSVGKEYGLETVNLTRVTGWLIDGRWVARKTDADLDREHREMVERYDRERQERLDANRADWQAREGALPQWVRSRLEHFRDMGGEHFETDGWAYELIVAELAVLYLASGGEDDDTINVFAREQGTSGNQHDVARALARMHAKGQPLVGTVSALSPITGDPFYESP